MSNVHILLYFAVMLKLVYNIRHYFEKHGFYVSSRLADRLGMRAKNVRLFFIYMSFATLGVGFALYLTSAFLLKLKDVVYTKRTSVFDL
ncbi:MAG: phage shock protein PspC (stress-responsive transcriptional regulator) [Dokdonia sp.]|jgi:phage shock protein PspC (stress-responsive transcriptional regulator)